MSETMAVAMAMPHRNIPFFFSAARPLTLAVAPKPGRGGKVGVGVEVEMGVAGLRQDPLEC